MPESGAPKPGGRRAPNAGGYFSPRAGGINLATNYDTTNGHAEFDIKPGNQSGARVAQTRTAVNVRRPAKTTGVTYLWTLPTRPGGSAAVVTNGTTVAASFTPDVAGTYVLQCVITFTGSTKTATKSVTYVSA
jgi:hypothetical protein